MENSNQENNILVQRIADSLKRVETETDRLRRASTRLIITGLFTSAAATLVAGLTAIAGPLVGEGIPGWRLACIAAALFGFIATMCTGLEQQLKFSDRLAEANQCLARMRSLELTLSTGSQSAEQIAGEYNDTLRNYPGLI